MSVILNKDERENLLSSLTEHQRDFIVNHVKRGKKTVFANEMARDKGLFIPDTATNDEIEMLLDEWILEDYIDNGFINPETPCECGRPLRYQYIVKHKKTNEVRRFGINHFEEHTGIPAEVVNAIKREFSFIDYEMDEILQKINTGWTLDNEIPYIPRDFEFPKGIQEFLLFNVPLLDRDIKRLKTLMAEFLFKQELQREEQEEVMELESIPYVEDQVAFEFFQEEPKPISEKPLPLGPKLSEPLRDAVRGYLETVSSARIICELLIKNNSAPHERYLTGKPKIYPLVCMYLDSLVKNGDIQLTKKEGQIDRIYKLL
ncbi:MAG: DUF3895 domain-containing protein [Bacillota bacterium]|nr:DUF3895 domain-containing protein [Bacillota bacterium]